jgi:hypothetical protein
MTDEQITLAAREICAAQADKQDNSDSTRYLSGQYDRTVWMRLVEQGIRKGMKMDKFDPLVSIINEMIYAQPHGDIDEVRMADSLRYALEVRGLEIREKGQ